MDNNRIWKMTRLAMFEDGKGKEDLSITGFYRRDYVGLGLLVNFLLITLAYGIILGGIVLVRLNYLISNFDKLNVPRLISMAIIGYVLLLGLYTVFVFTLRRLKYNRAKMNVSRYYKDLNLLYEDVRLEQKKKAKGERHEQFDGHKK